MKVRNTVFALGGLGLMTTLALSGCATEIPAEDDPTEMDPVEAARGYAANVTTNPSPVIAGSAAIIDVRVNGPRASAVTAFDPMHTKPMHLIAVSSDLEDFIHVHPSPQPAGDLTVSATFARQEPYTLFMEYDPAGAPAAQLSRASVKPVGSHLVRPNLLSADAFGGSVSKTVVAGGTVVELVGTPGGMMMPNVDSHVEVRFRNTNGTPISDLTNWLGMPAHAIIVSPDLTTFVHTHGMAEGAADHDATTSTGPVGIDVILPKGGRYKMFVQFQRGATVITAPFVLDVMANHGPPLPPPPSCASMDCPAGQSCMVMGGAPMCM